MKKFSYEVIQSWIWWAKIYRKEEKSNEDAVKDLAILQNFVKGLKSQPNSNLKKAN